MHRGRDVLQVLDQYERTVKPSFESYILPTKKEADIIVSDLPASLTLLAFFHSQPVVNVAHKHCFVQIPRGAENEIAIDLILQHIKFRLSSRLPSHSLSVAA